jgi:hypothetical protein
MPSQPFDLSRARLRGPDYFKRYQAPDNGEPLAASGLGNDVELLVVKRRGESRALLMREVSYHHVAQGRLAGEPYVVSF